MRHLIHLIAFLTFSFPALAQDRIVALGDSLTSGYGLQPSEDFASKLQAALIAEGYNVRIENAGVSGNTSEQGRARLEQALAGEQKPRLVIVALGANDMLRKLDPSVPKENLSAILQTLKDRDIPALLVGIHRPTSSFFLFSDPYKTMFKDLSKKYDVPLYPFFLKGVALNGQLNLPDGLHPNAKGIDVIVENILPTIEDALED